MSPSPMNIPEAVSEAVRFVLDTARKRFAASDLARLEEAFRSSQRAHDRGHKAGDTTYQKPTVLLPGLSARPWHEVSETPAAQILEAGYPTIRRELEGLLNRRSGFQPFLDEIHLEGGSWNAYYLPVDQHRFAHNCNLRPETSSIVESIPRLGEMAVISALTPGTHITPHRGPWNVRITIHLGLIIPQDCEFRVAAETRQWAEGRCLVFDDSFEHEVWNRGKATRFCLFVDVWHPELSPIEVTVLEVISHALSHVYREKDRIDVTKAALEGACWWR